MNKKFLSAILFGALMVTSTGTFVSCKDYDDDIENLQGQINNLATKSDVEAKLAQLQAALNAAQAESSANAADIAALEKEVASMMAKVEAAVESEIAEYKTEIEALVKKVEALVGKVADFVTSVELVDSYTADNGNYENADRANLSFASAIVTADHVFGEDLTGELTFTKGDQVQTTDQFVVRVSPTNAVLTPEMISLVDSEGKNLDEMLTIVSVEKFNGVLGVVPPAGETRAATNTGLWTVTAQLTKYDANAFNAAALVKADDASKGLRLYAVQVNNAIGSADARYVSSSYDLTLNKGTFEIDSDLDFIVKTPLATEHVADINNRVYGYNSYSFSASANSSYYPLCYKELAWKDGAKDALKDNTKPVYDININDNRSKENVILGVQGEDITISIVKETAAASEYKAPSIAAMYVVLDKANAVESLGSEINAWNAYTYTGLNEVVKGTTATIKVDYSASVNDIIGFRVFAVNHDGKLVDPDGRAFYVRIGDPADDWAVAATSITPVSETWKNVKTEKVAVEMAKVKPAKVTFTVDEKNELFKVFVYQKNAEEATFALSHTEDWTYPTDYPTFDNFVAIAAQPVQEWYKYEDGKTYYGTLTAYDATGFEVGTLRVSFTKNIPTASPEGLTIKTNQVVDGIYNCYLIPNKWEATKATAGTMKMDQIFNFPAKADPSKYSIKFATTKYNADNEAYTDVMPVAGDKAVEVAAKLIDNETKHATTATYDYGYISSVNHAAAVAAGKALNPAYNVIVEEPVVNFETVYNCIYNDTYTWAWATREELHAAWSNASFNWMEKNEAGEYVHALPELTLTYGTEFTLKDIDKYIMGKSEWDNVYNSMLNPSYKNSLSIQKATFTSDVNGKEEYFAPVYEKGGHITSLKVVPNESNPTADVASTLTIEVKDMYGHDRVITIPAVVKPRKTEAAE